jgi:osmoprotectant transport system substrate-binding protein
MRVRRSSAAVSAALLLAVLLWLVACVPRVTGDAGARGSAVTVGSKNFTEQVILGELYAQALEAEGFRVERRLNLGNEQVADGALQSGEIDLYPEYTGTALAAILGHSGEPPKTPEETYRLARRLYEERDPPVVMLAPAGFESAYGIVVRRTVAEERDLETLGDLAEASPELTFVSFSEFLDRQDGYPNMRENYPALDFEEIVVVRDIQLRYNRLLTGEADAGIGFTTDPQLLSEELVVLRDEKGIWPYYHPAPVVRSDTLRANPEIEEILNRVSKSLTVETMRELNGRVDLDRQTPDRVARAYLRERGLIPEEDQG